MSNRFGSSSTLLTASSSDFSYLLEGGTGFVRALASTKRCKRMNYKNISVLRKNKIMASVNPTPHTIAKRMWLSSGRVPLQDIPRVRYYKNFLVGGEE